MIRTGPGSGLPGAVAVAQLRVGEAGRGRAECLWCLGDAPGPARLGGLAGGIGGQREPGAGEECLQCPSQRAGGGPIGSWRAGGGQHRGRGIAAAGQDRGELVQQRDRPRGRQAGRQVAAANPLSHPGGSPSVSASRAAQLPIIAGSVWWQRAHRPRAWCGRRFPQRAQSTWRGGAAGEVWRPAAAWRTP